MGSPNSFYFGAQSPAFSPFLGTYRSSPEDPWSAVFFWPKLWPTEPLFMISASVHILFTALGRLWVNRTRSRVLTRIPISSQNLEAASTFERGFGWRREEGGINDSWILVNPQFDYQIRDVEHLLMTEKWAEINCQPSNRRKFNP